MSGKVNVPSECLPNHVSVTHFDPPLQSPYHSLEVKINHITGNLIQVLHF